ncbi:MAG: hypothetical protein CMB74_06650 [Euryarchaeota archaeon]|nr:hypothetical protein [Euryarchaeota archaeon]
MRQGRAYGLVSLLLLVSILPMATAVDSTVSVNTTWSGDVVLTGNVTVANGATLTVSPGTTVDAKSYSIVVEGTMVVDQASFFSSVVPETQGSHGQGLWSGLVVEPGGQLNLTDSVVANASASVLVRGAFNGTDVVFNDAYRGLSVMGGDAVATGLDANRIDYEAVYVESGSLNLTHATATEVAVGLANHAQASVVDLTVSEAGVGAQSLGGDLYLSGFAVHNASVGFATVAGADTTLRTFSGTGLALAVDASDTDGLNLSGATLSGERFLVGQGVASMMVHDVGFVAMSADSRPAMDVRCDGTCELLGSVIEGPETGISWSGPGTSIMGDVQVHNATYAVEATGSGHADWTNITVSASETGLSVQTPTSSLANVEVLMTSDDAKGVDVLGGQHSWSTITVEKPFVSADRTSIGLNAWYSDLILDHFTARNMSIGMMVEDSTVEAQTTEANIGSLAGLHLVDASFTGTSLTTIAQDEGVLMEGDSTLHLASWTAQLHDTPLMLSTGSTATVRSFSPANTAPSSADALGDGTLYYGSSGNPTVSTTASYRLLETDVTFTDLAGQPVEANVLVHGFELVSNSNGALTLPLVNSGSEVDVTLDGAGTRVTLYGGQTGQSVQVPVIPDGDWTISSGQDVVLGPRPDGQPHQLTGDLTVANNGALTLLSTDVILSTGHSITLQGTGQLTGVDASIIADTLQASGQSMLTGSPDDSLTVEADVQWGCLSPREVENLNIVGSLVVQPGCEIDVMGGSIEGNVQAMTGAVFTSSSTLDVTVLDKGTPVEGALISIEGSVAMTDQEGTLTTQTEARRVTDSGETWGGIKTVSLQRGNFSDFVTWDTNRSLEHTFMASTVPTGEVSGWLVLERQWSPYTLDGSLLLQTASTMSVQDGVSLRVSEGASITVNGLFDAGEATISSTGYGARWGGLTLGTSTAAVIQLSGTQLIESAPALTVSGLGSVVADDVFMARSASDPLLVVESGSNAELAVRNSHLQNGSGCAHLYPSSGLVTFANVSFADCEEQAIWAQQVPLDLNSLTFDEGSESGLELTGVSGSVNGVDATHFNGQGAIVSLNNLAPGFVLSDVEGHVTGEGGIIGEGNEDLTLERIQLTGAPGIDVDRTSGVFSDLTLQGEGSGTAFVSHHGRSSDSLVVEGLNISGYSVGVSLHSDPGEISAPLILREANILVSSALATEYFPVRLENSDLVGSVDVAHTTVHTVDGSAGTLMVGDGGEYAAFRTVVLDARRGGTPVPASFTVSYGNENLDPLTVMGTTVDVELLLRTVSESSEAVAGEWSVQASVAGSPLATLSVDSPATAPSLLVVNVLINQAPEIQLLEPYAGQRVMEGDFIRASASYSDDMDSVGDLVLSWRVYDLQGNDVLQAGNEPVYNITDLPAGYYIVEVKVVDTFGEAATASMDFEYTLLDTDNDWSASCSSTTWFDANTGKSCGPNIYDEDDDNDGFSDAKDAFPLDPCAQLDTDGDTQPDVLDCPEGYTSWLTEDMDDDGDGTPDVLEGVETSDADVNLNALLLVAAIFVVVFLLFLARLRRGGPGDLTSLDQRHL